MKLSVGMHCIQTEKPSDFTAISFLVSRDWPHGADTRPLAGPGTGFQPCPASRRRPSSHVRDRRRPPSLRAPLQVLSAPRHRLPCCAQAPTTLHTPGTAFLFRWYCTALSCCPWLPKKTSLVATQAQPRRTGALTPLQHPPGPVGSRSNLAGVWWGL